MEYLRELEYTIGLFTFSAFEVLLIILTAVVLYVADYVLNRKLFRWYYNLESTSNQNKSRTKRVVRFVAISVFVIAALRILDIDYTFYDENIQRDAEGDGPPVSLVIRISTFVKALAAFVIANVLDLLLEELLVQWYFTKTTRREGAADKAEDEEAIDGFASLRPLLYTLACLYVATDIGLADFSLYNFSDARGNVTGQITLGRVLQAAGIFFAIRLALKVMTGFILRGYYSRSQLDTGSQFAINRLLTYFVYFIGVLLVVQAMGFDLLVIWTGAAALLVGIGIGLQQTFNDLICGVIILFERSVKVGDVVELSSHQVGTVRKVGARTSIVETRDDIIVFVPNSKLIGENVTNWSQVARIARFHVQVGVAYGSDTELVKKILLEVAAAHVKVLKQPAPIVRFVNFGDSSLDFVLSFHSRDFLRIEIVKSDLRFEIDRMFRERGVEIPFPQRDVWFRQED